MPSTNTTNVRTALMVRLDAKPGKEEAVATFLKDGLSIVLLTPPMIDKVEILAAKLPG